MQKTCLMTSTAVARRSLWKLLFKTNLKKFIFFICATEHAKVCIFRIKTLNSVVQSFFYYPHPFKAVRILLVDWFWTADVPERSQFV